jgi:hypothetical protein
MAKVASETRFSGAMFRMYCSCGQWYTPPVAQGSEDWMDAQEEFFEEHLARLPDQTYPERVIMEHEEDPFDGFDTD